MTFAESESSEYLGAPQECFAFNYFAESWLYTSSNDEVVIATDTYYPVHIKRSRLKNEYDLFKTIITVNVKADDPLAIKFRSFLEGEITLTLYRQHYGSTDPVVLWSGKVSGCKWVGNEAELSCLPLYNKLKTNGLVRVYQRACPHVQYGTSCGLDRNIWDEDTTIAGISGKVVTLDGSYAVSYFAGGSITVGNEKRWVVSSTATTVTMIEQFVDAAIDDLAVLLPGCQHSASICRNTFNNELNNGGFYFIPSKNPFMVSLLG